MTVLPRLLREVRRRALRARTRAKESVRGTLKPHSQAARSRCTLKPHAQAARSGCTLKHCVCASVGGAILEDNKDRCRSMAAVVRERQKHGVTRFGRRGVTELGRSRKMCLRCVKYGRSYDSRLWRRSDRCLAASSRCAARPSLAVAVGSRSRYRRYRHIRCNLCSFCSMYRSSQCVIRCTLPFLDHDS